MLRVVFFVVAVLFSTSASARSYHHHRHHHHVHHTKHGHHARYHKHVARHAARQPSVRAGLFQAVTEVATEAVMRYLPHPSGCPRMAFCGCGAAQEIGRAGDRSLWQARSWYKFPRSNPAPGMAGVRAHHVFVLREHLQGNVWLVADYNSGGHLSRLHARSISGYAIVNPGG